MSVSAGDVFGPILDEVPDTWYQIPGTCRPRPGTQARAYRYLAPGIRHLLPGTTYLIRHTSHHDSIPLPYPPHLPLEQIGAWDFAFAGLGAGPRPAESRHLIPDVWYLVPRICYQDTILLPYPPHLPLAQNETCDLGPAYLIELLCAAVYAS